ncbi:MAG: diguanylate cyclase [Sphingobacteriia bacterium]|nr:diguanylate cyclase [Sphingobacteriia bacterium]NCC39809.1 diguanylate cyclase [Gammaproteobacteria bacterium]
MSDTHQGAPRESFKVRKARLRAAFIEQLPQRLKEAHQRFAALAPDTIDQARLEDLYIHFHTLKGSCATFGFEQIGDVARTAEERVREAMDAGGAVTSALIETLAGLLAKLDALVLAAGAQTDPDITPSFELPPDVSPPQESTSRSDRLIYLCDDDPDFGAQLAAQLGCFGYRVSVFTSLEVLATAVAEECPSALILDVMFPRDQHGGPKALAAMTAAPESSVPCIFVSCRDDFVARLQAVRAGGNAYCTKPIKMVELLELLDRFTNPHPSEPINVLVVDDDRELAQLHATVLEEAGMVAKAVSDPEQVPRILETFSTDLVLMDMYMPDCSGPELARVLRQMPGHLSLPIIYVSSETDVARQHKALAVGADGFLTKPIEPARLVSEVALRAERMRLLHSLMVRDGLTGLFNHNTIMQYLEIAIANSKRISRPLAFAMIDVDHFKSVNDTYGHPTGDHVLMALSRTLRLRLRDTDVVGRYGGEEFAVVLNGMNAQQARCILEDLRVSFAGVTFHADGQEFHCTFSVGVSVFPIFERPDHLTEAADRALYRAKHAGRNRVEIATAEDLPTLIDAGSTQPDAERHLR